MKVEDGFQQVIPGLANGFSDDLFLQSLLRRLLPHDMQAPIFQDLERLGHDVNGPIRTLGALADTPPTLTQYSHWGRRVDVLHTSEGWRRLKSLAAQEGLVSISYERSYGEYSRIYAFTKTHLFTAEGRVVGCPISMTDGCARVLELLGTEEMKRNIMPRLTSRDPRWAFTAGQFMTERSGGSDISLTETVATPVDGRDSTRTGAPYRLNGFKWFSSATDSELALVLGRTGDASLGSRSLSLFLLPLRLPLPGPGTLTPSGVLSRTDNLVDGGEKVNNGILVHRLKNKIGTHSLPTAELSLDGSLAYLVGPLNGGVKAISTVLQITRLHSAFHSVGSLARCLATAKEFSKVRNIDAGRRRLDDVPLHVAALAKVEVTYRAILSLALNTAHLLGQVETMAPDDDDDNDDNRRRSLHARFRLINPVLKAFATHHGMPAMEECMAALGGQGYMEESGIGRLMRDAVVERIWEGTENVLAMDLMRAARKGRREPEPLAHWSTWATAILEGHSVSDGRVSFATSVQTVQAVVDAMPSIFAETAKNDALAHTTLLLFGHATSSLYLLEHALWAHRLKDTDAKTHTDAFVRWVLEGGVSGRALDALYNDFTRLCAGGGRAGDDKGLVYGHTLRGGKAKL